MKKILFLSLLFAHYFCLSQDLVVSGTSGPTSFDQYQTVSVSITIKNDGIVPISKPISSTVYFSSDNILDGNDLYFGNFNIDPLGAGQSKPHLHNNPFYFSSPPPGSYFLIIVLDKYLEILETDETNNTSIIPGYTINNPNVDWQFSYLTIPSSISANNAIFPIYEVKNIGTTDIGFSVSTSFYISADATLSSDDTFLESFSSLNGSDIFSNRSDAKLIIPNLSAGEYYIIGKTDDARGNSYYTETNENNNTIVSAKLNVGSSDIDLELTRIESVSGSSNFFNVLFTVKNDGTTAVDGYKMNAYLSRSELVNDRTFYIAPFESYSNNLLLPGESKTLNANISSNYNPGRYYLFIELNPNRSIPETNYTNNTLPTGYPINIFSPPIPSWTITNVNLIGTYDNTDKEINVSVNFLNSGTDNYLSQNYQISIKNSSNVILNTSQLSEGFSLYAGGTTVKNWAINLANPLPVGQYTIEIACASAFGCYTNTYSLPLTIIPVAYTLTGKIQGEDGIPITKGKLFLYQKGDDGVIKFINKIVPTSSDQFSFQLDDHEHTLFFIPDRTDFAQYVPTIFGKTVLLAPTSFFKLSTDTDLTFEILKITPGSAGGRTIGGSVATQTPPGGRVEQTAGISNLPIVLLSETGKIVAVTETDADGKYQFSNLAPGKYQLVIAFELDQLPMTQPVQVDITTLSATLDFNIGNVGVSSTYTAILESQSIAFTLLGDKKYGEAPFLLNASATSGLPISYASSNPSVAQVNGNEVTILSAGTTTISASQEGNSVYLPATKVERILTVLKADQTIAFTALVEKKYGDAPFTLNASASSGLPISYASSNPTVVQINGNKVTILSAGTTTISANQEGNSVYLPATKVERILTVLKANQTIAFTALAEKRYGEAPFILNATASSGLSIIYASSNPTVAQVNGNQVTILSAGTTTISASQEGNSVYLPATKVENTLTVLKASQTITFDNFGDKKTTDPDFQLVATSTSGLEVSFQSDNEAVAKVIGKLVKLVGAGTASITASQSGNQNFLSATSVVLPLIVNLVTGLEPLENDFKIYPNPTDGTLKLDSKLPIDNVQILDGIGKLLNIQLSSTNEFELNELSSGVYYLRVKFSQSQEFKYFRVVRK
ncbi:MAG: T9SS type A sorting domain-containing protein [Cytophagales bacterium]|nr:T9SS type A sorting domain-containing protein [Cytophagales bacterium]MCA6372665.1 T9SS type A sorting domain-containing protein [Cytophagales bacterium]MCA6376260.1 T9SS type A sorting domain-containing protein [Cytophagales bacterium]MCA6385301.1 T9SS type A sorting domain-containing protein [Cytophagales bacterium]